MALYYMGIHICKQWPVYDCMNLYFIIIRPCCLMSLLMFFRNLLEFGNLQEHLEKVLAEHNNECVPSMESH